MNPQPVLFDNQAAECSRCGAKCRVSPKPGSQAKMLRRGDSAKGYCINCAVHDVLRNLYPANLLLAHSGPACLALPHIQEQFQQIVKVAGTDAEPGEINWQRIADNWDLAFPTSLTRSPMNPVSQKDLDREQQRAETEKRDGWKPPLTERELRAKRRAEISHAACDVMNAIDPGGPPIKIVRFKEWPEDGTFAGMDTTISIEREDESP